MKGIFVAGTDTGVGKTVVSALILARYGSPAGLPSRNGGARREGPVRKAPRLAYWKPVATGGTRDRDVSYIASRVGDRSEVIPEEYSFDPPVSPHLAARGAGVEIRLDRLRAAWAGHGRGPRRSFIVEGAGGLLVPLNDRGDLLIDLIGALRLPVVLVARTALGTINHTLLSLEALRARRVPLAGVVLDGPANPPVREAIERFGRARVVSEVPPLGRRRPSREALLAAARSFDPGEALRRILLRGSPP